MIDAPKVEQMLASLHRYTRVLQVLAAVPRDELLSSGDKLGNAKYHFVVGIECCIDIANHIIAAEGFRIPRSNADSFAVLAEQGILPMDQLAGYQSMARFRNRLVHMYWEVDDTAVFDFLQADLPALDAYAVLIATWLAAAGPDEVDARGH